MPTEQCPYSANVKCSNTVMRDCRISCGIYQSQLKRQKQIKRTKVKRKRKGEEKK